MTMRLLRAFLWVIVVVLLAALASMALPDPARSASARITWVEDHTGPAWPVSTVVPFVDQYTGSYMRYGACRVGAKCVRVYEKTINSLWGGVTYLSPHPYYSATDTATVYVNPQRNGKSWATRRQILTHELGHAMGIWWHSAYCTNIMYSRVNCPDGSLPTYRFGDPQRVRLAVN